MIKTIIDTRIRNIIFDNLDTLATHADEADQLDNLEQYTQDNYYNNIIYDKIEEYDYFKNYKRKMTEEIIIEIFKYSYYYEHKDHFKELILLIAFKKHNELIKFYAHHKAKQLLKSNTFIKQLF